MNNDCYNYKEWKQYAIELDTLLGRDEWKNNPISDIYDFKLIQSRLNYIKQLASNICSQNRKNNQDIHALLSYLRAGLMRNIGGIGNPKLFSHCYVGTKKLIEEYNEEVVKQLEYICDNEIDGFPLEKKFDYFFEIRQGYGRSALLLSGGATMGMYHLGVVKTLFEEGLLPKVISGSSVGSIIAALVCVMNDEELPQAFYSPSWNLNAFANLEKGSLKRKFIRLIRQGVLMDIKTLETCVRENIGDITFKEAYDKTKRILNITVTNTDKFDSPRLLNYITAPNVLIWSAASASCALPFLFSPVELMAKDKYGNIVPYQTSGKKWIDGSVGADLPMKRLSELFNVNHFIVSQVNPHVAPFLLQTMPSAGPRRIWSGLLYLIRSEIKHRINQFSVLGLIPSSLSKIPSLVTQKYYGDITIVPNITFSDYQNLFSNPTKQFIDLCIRKGSLGTWPKITQIKNQCMIEFILEKAVEKLGNALYLQHTSKILEKDNPTIMKLLNK